MSSDERVGQYLANQRRLRRITLEELAERTRIPRRNLERLESGAFDSAADGFTRGFVRTVAEALGLDADEAVMRLVGEPRADEDRALRATRRAAWIRIGVVIAIALLAVVGAGLLIARLTRGGAPSEEPVVYRRDVVRSLAEDARPQPAPPEPAPSR